MAQRLVKKTNAAHHETIEYHFDRNGWPDALESAAEWRAEEQRQRVAQRLIVEEEAAKKKAARQAEARAKKRAKKAKQHGLKQKAPSKDANSESEQVLRLRCRILFQCCMSLVSENNCCSISLVFCKVLFKP